MTTCITLHCILFLVYLIINIRNDDLDNDGIVVPEPILVPQRQFAKTKHAEILTRYGVKAYRAVYTKGHILPELKVVPYGYQG